MKRFLSSAAIGLFAFAGIGAAQADNILLNDPVVVEVASGDIGNSYVDLGPVNGTFTLSQASTVVLEGLTSTNSGITGEAYITNGGSTNGAFIIDTGIGAGQIDTATATLPAGTYAITYNLGNSSIEGTPPSAAENLVDIQVDAAPEINPASAASGLTLLAGALLVLRGRRRPTAVASFA